MKTLFLIRHAKSSWTESHLSDFERPLNQRGIESLAIMGESLKEELLTIGHIFSSSAARAHATANGLAGKSGVNSSKISFHGDLYHASVRDLLKFTCAINNSIDVAAITGHNPGLTDYSNYLTDEYIDNIPTCGIVKINFNIANWQEVSTGTGRQEFFRFPKGED